MYEKEISDQVKEMECLRKTEDIRDELNMIYRVLEDQSKALSDFTKRLEQPEQAADTAQQTPNLRDKSWDKLLRAMTFRQERVEKLGKQAERVESWVLQHFTSLYNQ
jgi:uncharacterized protein (DUF3084 family)